LLETCVREERSDTILKLASLPKARIETILLARGLDPGSIADAKEALARVDAPITPKEAVDYSFQRRGDPSIFGKGRFGDGTAPVFYAALEKETCQAEVKHHAEKEAAVDALPRFYHLLACDFKGLVAILIGKEVEHPELISPTEEGYPFCQALARRAREARVRSFYTRSARHPAGTCTPVFARPNVTNERTIERMVLVRSGGEVRYESA
jgi:hypothetical protein